MNLTIKKNCHRYYFLNNEYVNEPKTVAKISATLPPFNAFFDGLNDILIRNHVYRISYFLSWKAFNTPPPPTTTKVVFNLHRTEN